MSIFAPLLAPSSSRSNLLRRALAAGSTAVHSAFAPSTLFVEPTPKTSATVEPVLSGVPAVEDIEAAADAYHRAAELARQADRSKRAAKKVLDALPLGRYGSWLISRKPSTRQTPDLAAIVAIFEAHGLGPVPMRAVADSLTVSRCEPPAEVAA